MSLDTEICTSMAICTGMHGFGGQRCQLHVTQAPVPRFCLDQ